MINDSISLFEMIINKTNYIELEYITDYATVGKGQVSENIRTRV